MGAGQASSGAGRGGGMPATAVAGGVPAPAVAPDAGELPHALTFFLTGAQRAAVLRALRRVDADRARALLRVLRVG